MKKIGFVCLAFLLSACATVHQEEPQLCREGHSVYLKGLRDGEAGKAPDEASFSLCSEAERAALQRHYRDGYAWGHSQHRDQQTPAVTGELIVKPQDIASGNRVVQAIPTSPWVCEVVASAKVFTGFGNSRDEAVSSAKESCGAHFQASRCGRMECKKSLE